MDKLIVFILGCIFSRYILLLLDYLLDWFASYVSLRISHINKQINDMALEQNQAESTHAIGFVVQDDEFDDYFDDE